LKAYEGSLPVVVHRSSVNFGKGAALRNGIERATGEILLVQDGDLEYDPADYRAVLEPIVSGSARVVYGSRFQRKPTGMKAANRIANCILTRTANLLFGCAITDEATAYKAFHREVLDGIRLRAVRFEFCPEVTAKLRRLGYTIFEVPISYNPRNIREGKKIRWWDGVQAMWTLLYYRFAPLKQFSVTPEHRTAKTSYPRVPGESKSRAT
jgi:glycosyltransferase involved in cell wall biosynthesis